MTKLVTFSIDGPSHFYAMINQQVSYPELKSGEDLKTLGVCLSSASRCCGSKGGTGKECENIYNNIVNDLKEDEEKLTKIKSSMSCDRVRFMLNGEAIYEDG